MTLPTTTVNVQLLTADPEIAEWFVDDLSAMPMEGGGWEFTLGETCYRMRLFNPEGGEEVEQVLVLVRYMDVLTLQNLRRLLEALPEGVGPAAGVIYRSEEEAGYKMSCPYCGQKIRVRDVDVDKRGHCPNCKNSMTLISQEDVVRASLDWEEKVPVKRVMRGNSSALAGPLKVLAGNG